MITIKKDDKYYVEKSYSSKKHHHCSGAQGKQGNTRESAFKALNLTNQPVSADTFVKVFYQFKQFDLANEYNPITSVFRPKKDGVYSIIATIGFLPNDTTVDYRARVEIRVNGTTVIAIDNDFFGGNTVFVNAVSVSTIYNLEKGDQVEVFAQSNVDGTIVTTENVSHFEAARFPSPSE
ncbi:MULTISPECIES: hypothetical protein [Priestia]|jgi:hypothetical protein|uniref:hypothetical protein n=1 Tax=Priestia TaxID=2800373 RepID=UPI0020418E4C|nr:MULTISPECIES: hypothetical protein [Priestia]MCM3770363.1 hypothetical protein [Priestia aryabhattai]MDY0940731.1 hypothetical protein [Priestia megaterium]